MLSRHTQKRNKGTVDTRAATLPLVLPEPGDPERTGVLVSDMTWTVRADHEWLVRAGATKARTPSFGYFVQEANRWAGAQRGGAVENRDSACQAGAAVGGRSMSLKRGQVSRCGAGQLGHTPVPA